MRRGKEWNIRQPSAAVKMPKRYNHDCYHGIEMCESGYLVKYDEVLAALTAAAVEVKP